MRTRSTALAAAVTALVALSPHTASATGRHHGLERLAEAQTKLLFRYYDAPFGEQAASPPRCNQGQDRDGTSRTFLLPTLSYGSGDRTFSCRVAAPAVLVDLGGITATEGVPQNSCSSWRHIFMFGVQGQRM